MNLYAWGRVVGVALGVMFAPGVLAQTDGAEQAVQEVVQQIRAYGPKGQGTETQKAAAAKQLNQLLDLEGLAQRSLGDQWQKLSASERRQFIGLLHQLFERVAYPSAADFFGDLDLKVKGEGNGAFVLAPKSATVVNTELSHPDEGLVEIDFALIKNGSGHWRVADVVLDEVSLGLDIRTQMQESLRKDGYTELKRRIREKIEEEGDGD